MASSACFCFFSDFSQVQSGLGAGQRLESLREILYRIVILVHVPFDPAAQNIKIHHEFIAAGLPIVQRHLFGARFRVRLGDTGDQARVVINGAALACVIGHLFENRRGDVHRLDVFRL